MSTSPQHGNATAFGQAIGFAFAVPLKFPSESPARPRALPCRLEPGDLTRENNYFNHKCARFLVSAAWRDGQRAREALLAAWG